MSGRSFLDALASAKPAVDRADKMNLYGWLIGRWTMDATVHLDNGDTHRGPGEIYFGWVLEGRAIQDVWILPGVFYGTTLRVYDPDDRCLAHPLERSAPAILHAPDRAARRAAISFSSARTMPAKPYAGALPK